MTFLKRFTSWNKGKKVDRREFPTMGHFQPHSEKSKRKISNAHKKMTGEKSTRWKGEDVSYSGLHKWVRQFLGKANSCEICGLNKKPTGKKRWFQWANISHDYRRKLSDWKQLCIPCHVKFDKNCGRRINKKLKYTLC